MSEATGAYGAANNIDLTQHLVTELRKAMEIFCVCLAAESGERRRRRLSAARLSVFSVCA